MDLDMLGSAVASSGMTVSSIFVVVVVVIVVVVVTPGLQASANGRRRSKVRIFP